MRVDKKKLKISLVLFFLLAAFVYLLFIADFSFGREPDWGVTFSQSYALDLQLDWRETYLAILNELKVDHIRLSAYWDEIEPEKDQYDFTDLDWQIQQATDRGVEIILTIGRRLPRWPECHDPSWVKHYPPQKTNDEILGLIKLLVERYQGNIQITSWQVENEPLFAWFGFCPPPDKEFLKKEIALVKSLDHDRPIIITDTGELSNWFTAAGLTDILGTTMYRVVWNKRLGFFRYWFVPPAFYHYKALFAAVINPNLQRVIVTELQMEPWTKDKHMTQLTLAEQQQSFNLEQFQANLKYVRRTGFSQVYLWGAEYWYWLRQKGHPQVWLTAKTLWQ